MTAQSFAAAIRGAVVSTEFDRLNIVNAVTEAPDGFVIGFEHAAINPVHWPTTTGLRWVDGFGWCLVDTATGALVHRLPIAHDAEPRHVAKAVAELLAGGHDEPDDDDWDGLDQELEDALMAGATR